MTDKATNDLAGDTQNVDMDDATRSLRDIALRTPTQTRTNDAVN